MVADRRLGAGHRPARQLGQWRDRHPARVRRSVAVHLNLSRRQLAAATASSDRLAAALAAHCGLAAGRGPPGVHRAGHDRRTGHDGRRPCSAQLLRELGVELHLDNFGTGQSSLSALHRYPLSGIKVGGNFTLDALTNPADRTVLAALVGLARDLDLRLVAEGIETAEQVDLLRQLGCDRAQGYRFARPLEPADAETFAAGIGRPESQ